MELFEGINKEHLLKAIAEIDENGIRKGRHSSTYDLIYNGRAYPPKLVLSIAGRIANGKELNPDEFEGGEGKPAFEFLRKHGFKIVQKNMSEQTQLTSYLQEYADSEEVKKINKEEFDQKVNYFKAFFHENNLKKIMWEDIQELGSNLWCMSRNPIARGRAFGKPNAEISKYSKSFDYLVNGTDADALRINNCLKNDKYRLFGISASALTEILAYTLPNKFCIDNNRSRFSLEKLGIELKREKGESYGDFFVRYNDRILNILIPAYNLIVKPTHGLPPMIAIDQFFSWFYANYGENDSAGIAGLESEEDDLTIETMETKLPLNTILYGPPGTGKTYGTMAYAVQIIENLSKEELANKYKTREEIKSRYLKYLSDNQIAFTTFHQSFSYEDFIEGIKPVMPLETVVAEGEAESYAVGLGLDEDNSLQYQIQPGIFKMIADEARSYETFTSKGVKWKRRLTEKELTGVQFFKMSLGNTLDEEDDKIFDYCIKEGCIALGYGSDIDFTGVKNRADIITKFKENQVELKKMDFRVSAVERFALWMKPGDIVLISLGNHRLRAVGKVKDGGYYFNPNSGTGYNQYRNVEWLMVGQEVPVAEVYQKVFSQQTIYAMYDSKIKKDFFTGKTDEKESEQTKRNHVLIIDEINRGNIANIFGELITLIEDDKREGAKEAITVKLPYSKKPFSVPSNLFILGTMNTADKSVEALDSALRRRFTFLETPPEPEKLRDIGIRSIVYLFEKFKHVDWYDEPWLTHEKDLLNLIINKESFEILGKAYDKINPGIGKTPKDWGLEVAKSLVIKSGTEFIDFEKMLKVINNRIEKLLDKDHRIGHAYFINLHQCDFPFAELKNVFNNKILPLLQEYFFGDFGKIGLVLGDSFVVKHTENNTDYSFAKFKGYSEESVSDLKERSIFKFTDSKTWTTETFTSIYL